MPNSSERRAFMAGRASRDAEVAKMIGDWTEAEAGHAAERWRLEAEVESLRQQLAGAEHARDQAEQTLAHSEQQLAKRDAVIERVRAYGEKMLNANGMSWCSVHGRSILSVLDTAPPTALNAVKADAWDEGVKAAFHESIEGMCGSSWTPSDMTNPYRKGADHDE